MSDLIYSYVRGKGWVLGPDVFSVESVFKDGTKVRIELRDPLPGEYFNYARKSSSYIRGRGQGFVRDTANAARAWRYLDYANKFPYDYPEEEYYFAVMVLI